MTDPASGSAPLRALVERWRNCDANFQEEYAAALDRCADELEALIAVSEPPRCETCGLTEHERAEWAAEEYEKRGRDPKYATNWRECPSPSHQVGVQAQEPRCDGTGWLPVTGLRCGCKRHKCPGCVACKGES